MFLAAVCLQHKNQLLAKALLVITVHLCYFNQTLLLQFSGQAVRFIEVDLPTKSPHIVLVPLKYSTHDLTF